MRTTGEVLRLEPIKSVTAPVAPLTTTWYDQSRHKNNGAITGATWVQLPSGVWVMSFDGVGDKITAGGTDVVSAGTLGVWHTWLIGRESRLIGTGTKFVATGLGAGFSGVFPSDFLSSKYVPNLTYLDLYNNSFSGDLSGWTIPNVMTYLVLRANSFSGDLSGWTIPNVMTYLDLYNNSFSGDLSGWTIPGVMTGMILGANSFSGDLSGWTIPNVMTVMDLYGNSFSGDLSGWTIPNVMTYLVLAANSFSGDLSGWTIPNVMTYLSLAANSFSGHPSGLTTNKVLATADFSSNAIIAQADIDAILADCVTSLGGRVACTLSLNGGTNAAPSAAGLANKATLVAAGWTVTNN